MRWVADNLSRVVITPVLTVVGAYTAEDCVGTLNTSSRFMLRRGGQAKLRMARLADKASQIHTHGLELYFFRDNPSNSTFTDNSAFAINDADAALLMFSITFAAGVTATLGKSNANQFITLFNQNQILHLAGDSFYTVAKTPGTPTWTDGDLSIELQIARS